MLFRSVSSLGPGVEPLLQALREQKVGLGPIDRLGLTGMKSSLAGLVPPFRGADIDRRIDFKAMNPISRFATAAARLALGNAGLRVGRRNAENVGIVMGVCNGPDEQAHMDSVFSSESYAADVTSFSNITANSTAGWVSNALCLKGVNTTLAPGLHAGLQSMAYAFDTLAEGRVETLLAGAADEVYPQTYYNYDLIDFLYCGEQEGDYRIRPDVAKRKVLGEGAGMMVMETLDAAKARGATVLAEVLGYGMSMDADRFSGQCLSSAGMGHALQLAVERSSVDPETIDLVVWAPQGNAQDRKVLEALRKLLGRRYAAVPPATTTFNTGFIEAASIVVSLAAALRSVNDGARLWPQRTGIPELDRRTLAGPPRHSLVCAGSDLGYNYALIVKNGPVT